jgi:predicted regulator of Ras-like GTPase activity (Roadblock/LC7/MglB family)
MAHGRTYKIPIFKPHAQARKKTPEQPKIPVEQPTPSRQPEPNPELEALLKNFGGEMGTDLISTVVAGRDGVLIAGIATDPQFNQTDAAARFSIVMNLAGKVSLKLGTGRVEDNLTTTGKAYVLTRYIGDGTCYWGVAVLRSASLGFVRVLMNEYSNLIWTTLSG